MIIDTIFCNGYKGTDSNVSTIERNRLPEDTDVIQKKKDSEDVWNEYEYPIKTSNLTKVYKGGLEAVGGTSFNVKRGEVFGLLGPNGAGKSSMFNIMTMEQKRTSGGVKLLNKELDEVKIRDDGAKFGVCPQHNTIWEQLTVD